MKEEAGDRVRRLGQLEGASLANLMKQFESYYGTLESKESVMRNLYSCEQRSSESVLAYASRLDDLFDKAVSLGAARRGDMGLVKDIFYSGLKKDLKHLYQRNSIEIIKTSRER